MKKRLKQAFLETSTLLEWFRSQMVNNDGNIHDDLWPQMLHTEKKYDKLARRLGYPTRSEELEEIIRSMDYNHIESQLMELQLMTSEEQK